MKIDFVDRLLCPISGNKMKLVSFEAEEINDGEFVVPIVKEGILISEEPKIWYPISNYVPVLLVFSTKFHNDFYSKNKDRILSVGKFSMPNLKCEQGENFVQKTFTEEWNLTQESELSFLRTDEDLVNLNRHVWLKWIDRDKIYINSLLNVGCGVGKETIALSEVTRARNIVAVDLNFAVMQAGSRYKNVLNIEFIICSLFHMPLEKSYFDLVYSQGVIHHTFSASRSFEKISEFVSGCGFLFVWVYALEDHLVERNYFGKDLRNSLKYLLKNCWWWMECMLRPWLSKVPSFVRIIIIGVLSIVLHPLVKSRVLNKDKWQIANTRHSLCDVFTPAYASRHGFNEVTSWFEESDFSVYDIQSPYAHKKFFNGKTIYGIGMTGRRKNGFSC